MHPQTMITLSPPPNNLKHISSSSSNQQIMSFLKRYLSQSFAPSSSAPSYAQVHTQQQQQQYSWFPAGTHPDVIRSFQMVDRDRSGFIDENELQQVLSTGYQRFSLRTIQLLLFLFKNPKDPLRFGPIEFNALWSCLGQWRGIFERFDKDRSGKIDATELKDALYSLGYAIPPSVLQVLISKYENHNDDGGAGGGDHRDRVELNFDSFVECGMIVKGLTEKFKEKDRGYTGSATLTYDAFMTMIIPFLVS